MAPTRLLDVRKIAYFRLEESQGVDMCNSKSCKQIHDLDLPLFIYGNACMKSKFGISTLCIGCEPVNQFLLYKVTTEVNSIEDCIIYPCRHHI